MREYQKTLLPIVLLFIIAVGHTEIAYGQPSLTDNDGCICYTDEMDKKALECLINTPKKDSLISNYSLQMLNFKQIMSNQDVVLQDNVETISKQEDELQKINLHLVRAKRNTKVFGVGGLVVGFVGVLLIK